MNVLIVADFPIFHLPPPPGMFLTRESYSQSCRSSHIGWEAAVGEREGVGEKITPSCLFCDCQKWKKEVITLSSSPSPQQDCYSMVALNPKIKFPGVRKNCSGKEKKGQFVAIA